MPLTRTRRRLIILGSIALVLCVGVGGLYLYRQGEQRQQHDVLRAEGMAASEAGRHEEAVDTLGRYLLRQDEPDPEAEYARARALADLPRGGGAVARAAISSLYRVLDAEPDHPHALRDILALYERLDEPRNVVEVADRLLAHHPADPATLAVKAAALAGLGRDDEALHAARAATDADPDTWRMHLLVVQLLAGQARPETSPADYAATQRESHPEDPRFEMLQGVADGLTGDTQAAARWLTAAARKTPPDEGSAAFLLDLLDRAGLYDESLAFLTRHADAFGTDRLPRELAWRLFEGGFHDALATHLARLEPADLDTDRVALAAWLLLGREPLRAGAYTSELEARAETPHAPHAPHAAAWLRVIEAGRASDAARPAATLDALHQAIEQWPHTFLFHALLADVYAAGGEAEFALGLWRQVGDARPAWTRPHLRMAELLLELERPAQALRHARYGLRRDAHDPAVLGTLARAWAETIREGQNDDASQALAFIEQVQSRHPGEPDSLLAHVEVLAHADRHDEARDAADHLLATGEAFADETRLLRLADLCRQNGYDAQTQAVDARIERTSGQTPRLAYARARELVDAGDTAGGLALFDALRDGRQADSPADADWLLKRAQLLDAAGDPDASAAWARLADAHPSHVPIQRQTLESPSARGDRALIDRTIDRLATDLGGRSLGWRVARGRWLLGGDVPSADAGHAIHLLRHVVEQAPHRADARLLLAEAYEVSGNAPMAKHELHELLRRDPGDADATLRLVGILVAEGQNANARLHLDRLRDTPHLTPATRDRVESLAVELRQS